jgi:hypothetical protein
MLSNGSTAIDGLPAGAALPGADEVAALVSRGSIRSRRLRTCTSSPGSRPEWTPRVFAELDRDN